MRQVSSVLLISCLVLSSCSSGTASQTGASNTAVSNATGASNTAVSSTAGAGNAAAISSPNVSDAPTAGATATASSAPRVVLSDAPTSPTVDPTIARPFEVFVPKSYDGSVAVPLVILLHGYSFTGAIEEAYLRLQPLAESRGFLYIHPDASPNALGQTAWNATDACCTGPDSIVDDSTYLAAIIESTQAKYKVDPKRIYLIGHSNGGFMSYRMACDHADKIAAIATLAGATFADTSRCRPSSPVNVLAIHGTADQTIKYEGATIAGRSYPSAKTTTSTWAGYNGCRATSSTSPTKIDFEANIAGDETAVDTFDGCPAGGAVELWTIDGGGHVPAITKEFSASIIDFLFEHPKP